MARSPPSPARRMRSSPARGRAPPPSPRRARALSQSSPPPAGRSPSLANIVFPTRAVLWDATTEWTAPGAAPRTAPPAPAAADPDPPAPVWTPLSQGSPTSDIDLPDLALSEVPPSPSSALADFEHDLWADAPLLASGTPVRGDSLFAEIVDLMSPLDVEDARGVPLFAPEADAPWAFDEYLDIEAASV
ncbi:hypothetical protein DFJ74DRAFT_357705 [Hyaloraphidium curvatum]|nr:hypothetical protein DFJ74DRAFT_357705 [Hyaloraphidium curvatum]